MALRTRWRDGSSSAKGSVVVSVTDFTCANPLDMPAIFRAGMTLRRSWPDLSGAIGLWLWTIPLRRRCGSISIWQDETALNHFVAWPPHVAIMRRFRHRGTIRAHTWESDRFDPAETWLRAHQILNQAGRPSQSVPL
ncbi:hypothetical protein ACH35V_10160 [Actinomadura sp. 1N219]|uniref:hypothetical protein n=1 Tax=Actinomadura sp. 1N219 TaxID=3375152 RepID=UPI0037976132